MDAVAFANEVEGLNRRMLALLSNPFGKDLDLQFRQMKVEYDELRTRYMGLEPLN